MNDTSTQARQLARAITDYGTNLTELAAETPREVITQALESYRDALRPMAERQTSSIADDLRTLGKAIGVIGARIRPDLDQTSSENWIASMIDSLDQYSPRIAILAAKDAKREPVQFPAQVLEVIMRKAEHHLTIYNLQISKLERMLAIHDHPPLLTATDEAKAEANAISHEDLQAMPDHLRSLGLTGGFLIEMDNGQIRWATDDEQRAQREERTERRSRARKGDR